MHLDPGTKKSFEAILNQKEELKEAQETLKESVKKLADELGVKPAVVTRILGLVEKERAKGGVLADERDMVETAGEIV
jgi:Mn-dependent DtxR family transcriptional regulator